MIREIRTERLVLVPLRVEHAEEMAEVMADPALYGFTGGEPERPTELRARYERWTAGSPDPAERWWNWVVRLRAEDRLVGWVQATVATGQDEPAAEVAWVVGTPWQGRGIATEAARGLVTWLVGQGVRTVTAHVHPEHGASAAVAAAAGLAPTGERLDGEVRWRLRVAV
ncbi:GNAT family N-acetyltransferase [Kitasatospora atroaurantiaca]|uniref:RimJ/RimL family protein N-acetyltransferase n=1 Tax=Kitasatospora atroaurantiaca TaxID=285545 RepID=A0A561ESH3_9ACTN|nr:GNAT family N-acetyltransferase [Kitasatospora atroaurantiaca]TWE18563.1 RimJ/RimL family protein N-acetyltransferase [Kitasatospora atroaurantiaca]